MSVIGERGGRYSRTSTEYPSQSLEQADGHLAVLETIHLALMHGRCLRLRYRSEEETERIVHPLGLVQHPPSLYLVVKFSGFKEPRLLAVHRIRAAALLNQKSRAPDGFDLVTYNA